MSGRKRRDERTARGRGRSCPGARGGLALAFGAMVACLAAGCGGGEPGGGGTAPEAAARSVVVVAHEALRCFATRIGGELVEVRFPAAGKGNPADWRPGPKDVLAMQRADRVLVNGAGYEPWLGTVSIPGSRLVRTAEVFRERWIELEDTVTHSHGAGGTHTHGGVASTTWLDLSLAREQASAVRGALEELRPTEAATLQTRWVALDQELAALDDALRRLASRPGAPRVVYSHPVYQYFRRRYGLEGPSVHWEPDEEPDEEQWAALEARQRESGATWMIWEGEPLPRVVAQLEERGLASAVIDPGGARPAEGDFLTTMHANLDELARVVGP